MKLFSYLLMVIAMLLALTLSGCGGKELKELKIVISIGTLKQLCIYVPRVAE